MQRRVAVGDIMTRKFARISPSTDLHKCAKEMVKNRVNSLLVTNDNKLTGIITARDIMWVMVKKPNVNLTDIKVLDIATKKIAVIKPSADISQALHKMRQFGFRRLPVISKGVLVGIVTLKDILRIDPSLYNYLGELADIREESEKLRNISSSTETEGLCEICGAFSDLLKVEGRYLCPDCRDEMY